MSNRRKRLKRYNSMFGEKLEQMPKEEWEKLPSFQAAEVKPFEVWRSRSFLVVLYLDQGFERITINRAELRPGKGSHFTDRIHWDELQELKRQIGRAEAWAVECFPPDSQVVNVAYMRHLWLLPAPPAFGWKPKATEAGPAPAAS